MEEEIGCKNHSCLWKKSPYRLLIQYLSIELFYSVCYKSVCVSYSVCVVIAATA